MKRTLAGAIMSAGLVLGAELAMAADTGGHKIGVKPPLDPAVTLPQCRTDIAPVAGLSKIPAVARAVARGELRILAIGSSSTSGIGASSMAANYPSRLQRRLRLIYPGVRIVVVNRGIPGETAAGAAARMKFEARRSKPDLVLWQLGTNGALAKLEIERFRAIVQRTISWLRIEDIGVILIDPQFVPKFREHAHYARVVTMLWELARDERVMLVRRFAMMQSIARRTQLSAYLAADRFHLNDLGYRCMAAYAAQAVVHAAGGTATGPARPLPTKDAAAQ